PPPSSTLFPYATLFRSSDWNSVPGSWRNMTPSTRSRRGARLVGSTLERRYRVDSLIARGGMSAVYRGLDTRLDRPVAIKVMDDQYSGDRSFVQRFEREARAAAQLYHPNIVAVYDQGVDRSPDGDLVFLTMQLVEGCTLRDLLHEHGRLPLPLALSVMEPVLSALDRKSTRLNSSHVKISYAVFCLKKKKISERRCVQKTS